MTPRFSDIIVATLCAPRRCLVGRSVGRGWETLSLNWRYELIAIVVQTFGRMLFYKVLKAGLIPVPARDRFLLG